jgi:hypothetical protein
MNSRQVGASNPRRPGVQQWESEMPAAISFITASRTDPDSFMHESIPFASMCPKCGEEQPQGGYSRGVLLRLLKADDRIEAYCVTCDEFWSISSPERTRIAATLGG